MKANYVKFLSLSAPERAGVFETVAADLGTLSTYVEKDFWVCTVLDVLFNGLPDGHPALSFKGGTSLSKVFGLIQRFSEDIDITISKANLGFDGERDPANSKSAKGREKLIDKLHQRVSNYTNEQLGPALECAIKEYSPTVEIEPDPDAANDPALLVHYPKLADDGSPAYVKPRVKIELGARAAQEPNAQAQIVPYVNTPELPMNLVVKGIRTVTAERTFWEKIFILHGWQSRFRDKGKSVADRDNAARHYYDVSAMIGKTSKRAIANVELLDSVREHNKLFFRSGWKKYDEGKFGSFRIVPDGQLLEDIRADYGRMHGMFLGDAPPFDEVIDKLTRLERQLNAS